MNGEDIIVSGMGVICGPFANLSQLTRYLYSDNHYTLCSVPKRLAADLADNYPAFCLPDDLAEELTRRGGTLTVGMAHLAAQEALRQAALDLSENRLRAAICLGSSTGASLNFFDHYILRQQQKQGKPESMLMAVKRNPAMALARCMGGNLSGPFFTITNACSSSTDAIGLGAMLLRNNMCDVALVGGSDELSLIPYLGFISLMVYSRQACKPFDANRSGLNLGEGAGVLVLEKRKRLQQRKQLSLAKICGYGNAVDAYHLTAPHPEGRGLIKAQAMALHEAGIRAEELAFINAHGTATKNNDTVESLIFKRNFANVAVSATKGATGHTLGAAGAIEAAITVQCLLSNAIPASPGFRDPDNELGVAPTARAMPLKGNYAMSQSLAFGGQNAAIIFSREEQ
jgi:3-oxoacyl-[acyl-carrier-protein] synthase-1/3-oxoacyl-[acyl-carrier-protein] synthase II